MLSSSEGGFYTETHVQLVPTTQFKGAGGLQQDFLEIDFLVVSDRKILLLA